MGTLDKYIVRQFAINYVISFAVLVSIYIILDLFFNLDEFSQGVDLSSLQIMWAMVRYYGAHLFLYFAQISGVITLFAMAFTLARLQRDNEFVAIVSSGVSLYRMALTVIVVGIGLNALWLVDQELLIPRLAPRLAQTHKAVALNQPYGVWFLRDRDGSLLSASKFDHRAGELSGVLLMRRGAPGAPEETIIADRAVWQADEALEGGVWLLERGERLTVELDHDGEYQKRSEPVEMFRSELSPDDVAMRQSTKWIQFLSRSHLSELRRHGMATPDHIARAIHNRFATPIVNMLILIIGVPIFLNRQPGSVVQSGGRCLLICGSCFLFAFLSQNLMFKDYPALTAWLPLIVLTPVTVISLDRIKT